MTLETFKLYGGKIELVFDPIKHKYVARFLESGIVRNPPSITTVLNVIDKPALVQWAVNQAILHLETRLSEGEHSPDDIERYLNEAKYAYRARTAEAGDIGTQAHNWLEEYWRRMMGLVPDLVPQEPPSHPLVLNCVRAGLEWIHGCEIEPIEIEKPVYSLALNVAGRLDKLCRINGKLSIVDWKSSTGLWPNFRFQTAAYVKFVEEELGMLAEQRVLVKLGKYDGHFEALTLEHATLEQDYAAFQGAVAIYNRLQELK